jgi:glutaredoxin-like protein DUF836
LGFASAAILVCIFDRSLMAEDTTMISKVQVVLYTKPGCHLCEVMKDEMAKAGGAGLYELQEINIESDADLLARFRYDIPVLMINGVEAFRHRLTAEAFRDYLRRYV